MGHTETGRPRPAQSLWTEDHYRLSAMRERQAHWMKEEPPRTCAGECQTLSPISGHALSPLAAFVLSMTSFHGRGFFPGSNFALDSPPIVLATLEALVGLIIEVSFIATLTRRLFSR